MLVNVCLDDIFFLITEYFVTKFGMVMWHHEPESQAEFFFYLVCHCQSQGHSEDLYDQNMTLSSIFSELLIP